LLKCCPLKWKIYNSQKRMLFKWTALIPAVKFGCVLKFIEIRDKPNSLDNQIHVVQLVIHPAQKMESLQ